MASEFVNFQRQLLKSTLGNDKRLEAREIVSQKSLLIPISQKLVIQTSCER
jgi:hypothetical protein